MKKLIFAIVALAALGTACSKYPGFKKDKDGFYYKFHVVNKNGIKPQLEDIVDMTFTLRVKDSVLIDNAPLSEKIIESLYPGDIFAAIPKMHIGDSATFIMNGEDFFKHFWAQPYPFETDELYFDLKLNSIIPKEEYEKIQMEREQEYETMIEKLRVVEDSLINDYITKNKITIKPTPEGLYIIKSVIGKGKTVQNGSTVSVHYTGMFLDGTPFDSSIDSGSPLVLNVGSGQVIPGWEKTLLLMKEGDKVKVIIPSKLAYGRRGADYLIPPYTPLLFEMEVVSIE